MYLILEHVFTLLNVRRFKLVKGGSEGVRGIMTHAMFVCFYWSEF